MARRLLRVRERRAGTRRRRRRARRLRRHRLDRRPRAARLRRPRPRRRSRTPTRPRRRPTASNSSAWRTCCARSSRGEPARPRSPPRRGISSTPANLAPAARGRRPRQLGPRRAARLRAAAGAAGSPAASARSPSTSTTSNPRPPTGRCTSAARRHHHASSGGRHPADRRTVPPPSPPPRRPVSCAASRCARRQPRSVPGGAPDRRQAKWAVMIVGVDIGTSVTKAQLIARDGRATRPPRGPQHRLHPARTARRAGPGRGRGHRRRRSYARPSPRPPTAGRRTRRGARAHRAGRRAVAARRRRARPVGRALSWMDGRAADRARRGGPPTAPCAACTGAPASGMFPGCRRPAAGPARRTRAGARWRAATSPGTAWTPSCSG